MKVAKSLKAPEGRQVKSNSNPQKMTLQFILTLLTDVPEFESSVYAMYNYDT
jgi:hypothetical protein